MTFLSGAFLLFFALVWGLTILLPPKARPYLLLPASWFFYAWHSIPLLGLLIFATAVSYLCGLGMAAQPDHRKKRRWLWAGCGTLLGLLFLFKYLDFAAQGIAFLLGQPPHRFSLVLPMGISFYVFQTLSYLLDVYWERTPAEGNPILYALFVSFFPQLVAGPIERSQVLLPQLAAPQPPTGEKQWDALRLVLSGFAQKVMIADTLAPLVDAAYKDPTAAGGAALAAATVLFGVQIYCDFSGYSQIAAGCAGLLGVRLSKNFDRPYSAVTVREFWRRWHISLTRWFTDYVYLPLGGSRRGTLRTCINLLTVFLLSGLWHGADLTFVVWGLLHGLYLVGELLLGRQPPRFPALRRCVTLFLVCFAWVFFRADSWSTAMTVLSTLLLDFAPSRLLAGLGISLSGLLPSMGLLCTLPLLERLPHLRKNQGYSACLCWLLVFLLILLCRAAALSGTGSTAFLYFQF